MPSPRQGDLFRQDEDEFDENRPTPVFRANPEKVRAELHEILAIARAARTLPWDSEKVGYYRLVFPQMSNWLPKDEAAQLCFEFEAELKRLEAA